MTAIKAQGRLLTATADSRLLRYLLLPYGEAGRTSAGTVTASAGSVGIPERIVANLEHDRTRPVAHSISIEDTDEGLIAEFRVAATTAGNDLLVEAAEGLRTGISVEIENPVIRKGALLAGDLTGAGFVTTPAFPSAQLMTAADVGELPADAVDQIRESLTTALDVLDTASQGEPADTAEPASDPDAAEASASPVPVTLAASAATNTHQSEATAEDASPTGSENTVSNAVAPAELLAASKNGAGSNSDSTDMNLTQFLNFVASGHRTGDKARLEAALTNITSGPIFEDVQRPQWIDELWSGRSYQSRFANLVTNAALTSMKVVGYRWVNTPTVGDYAGFPNEVPTSGASTEPVEVTADEMAGGWKIDRKFIDFGETAWLQAFFRHATDDYARKIDAKVLTTISSEAVTVTGGAVPSGVSTGFTRVVDGALALYADDVVPTFALVGPDVYREILLTGKDKVFEYISGSLGLESGNVAGFQILPVPTFTGRVVVGAREAVTLYQLPGSPIQASALDIARAGVDSALYGYYALLFAGKGLVEVV
jgi:hypothetical protein